MLRICVVPLPLKVIEFAPVTPSIVIKLPSSAKGASGVVSVIVQLAPTQFALFAGMLKVIVSGKVSPSAASKASRKEQSAVSQVPSLVSSDFAAVA